MDDAVAEELRTIADRLISFDTTDGQERAANEWLRDRLTELDFETYTWTADATRLADHPSFPDDPAAIAVENRPNVAGVVELGDPDAGPTLVLNGHVDVVPAERRLWSSDPFDPVRTGSGTEETLTGRGAADMKSQLAACVVAAHKLAANPGPLDGRIVVESVVGEEAGGPGAAAAALDNPYPFERDAAIVAEPTELTPVIATEGTLMARLRLEGRSAHAARRWRGESVLEHFETIRGTLHRLEQSRHDRVTHPLFAEFPIRWPIVVGRVSAGSWASTVPAELTAELRVGVAPGETVSAVEAELRAAIDDAASTSAWLSEHPPIVERFSVQFEPGEIDADEPVVAALQAAMTEHGLERIDPRGETYGADSRHYIAADIPTVVFGPGSIDQAHFPDESIEWPAVETAVEVYEATARQFLAA